MTTAILTAMKEEADAIISRFSLVEEKKMKNITVFQGQYNNEKIILVLAGIGKLQSAMATTFLFENYEFDRLVNIGIVGNVAGDVFKIGDVIFPTTFVQQDMYLPFDGAHLDYIKKPIEIKNFQPTQDMGIYGGVCATGDEFVDKIERIEFLRNNFQADICEMEAFSILSVAREYDFLENCIVIKAISDGADNESKEAHMDNLEFAMKNSILALEKVL